MGQSFLVAHCAFTSLVLHHSHLFNWWKANPIFLPTIARKCLLNVEEICFSAKEQFSSNCGSLSCAVDLEEWILQDSICCTCAHLPTLCFKEKREKNECRKSNGAEQKRVTDSQQTVRIVSMAGALEMIIKIISCGWCSHSLLPVMHWLGKHCTAMANLGCQSKLKAHTVQFIGNQREHCLSETTNQGGWT